MRVLVVGGSGYVAGLVLPALAREHEIRVLDRRPPRHDVEYRPGSAVDYADLRGAAEIHAMEPLRIPGTFVSELLGPARREDRRRTG